MLKTLKAPRSIAVATCAVMLLMVAGCGALDDDSKDDGGSTEKIDVTIEQQFGTAEITSVPTRVVTLNQQSTDAVVALGVTPVALAQDGLEFPWQPDGLPKESDSGVMTGLDVNFEKIASFEPDLIVGTYSIPDKGAFEKLNAIAPTIGQIEGLTDTWQLITETVGEALGESEKAAELIADTEAAITGVRDDVEGTDELTYSFVNFYDGQLYVPLSGDGSSELFKGIGLTLAPGLLGLNSTEQREVLSLEQLTLLDGDILLANEGSPDQRSRAEGDARWDDLPAVASGAVEWFDMSMIYALNTPSVLSIPYAIDGLEPVLQTAVDAG